MTARAEPPEGAGGGLGGRGLGLDQECEFDRGHGHWARGSGIPEDGGAVRVTRGDYTANTAASQQLFV